LVLRKLLTDRAGPDPDLILNYPIVGRGVLVSCQDLMPDPNMTSQRTLWTVDCWDFPLQPLTRPGSVSSGMCWEVQGRTQQRTDHQPSPKRALQRQPIGRGSQRPLQVAEHHIRALERNRLVSSAENVMGSCTFSRGRWRPISTSSMRYGSRYSRGLRPGR